MVWVLLLALRLVATGSQLQRLGELQWQGSIVDRLDWSVWLAVSSKLPMPAAI